MWLIVLRLETLTRADWCALLYSALVAPLLVWLLYGLINDILWDVRHRRKYGDEA